MSLMFTADTVNWSISNLFIHLFCRIGVTALLHSVFYVFLTYLCMVFDLTQKHKIAEHLSYVSIHSQASCGGVGEDVTKSKSTKGMCSWNVNKFLSALVTYVKGLGRLFKQVVFSYRHYIDKKFIDYD